MTKDQKTAIKAMMYSFDKYGAKRLCSSTYIPDIKKDPEYTMSFGEAYNICDEMINEIENENLEEKLKKITDVLEQFINARHVILIETMLLIRLWKRIRR